MDFFNNRRNQIIIGAVAAVLVILVAVAGWVYSDRGYLFTPPPQEVVMGDPADGVLGFYEPWLEAALSTSTDPYAQDLHKAPVLSLEVKKQIREGKGRSDNELDPVLCQVVTPLQTSARPVYENETNAQVVVVSRDKGQPEQAVVSLTKLNEGWYISDIRCTAGEVAPVREFSFDTEGFLVKSVPAPYKAGNWHLVFEQNGQPGHVVPLFFNAESSCTGFDGVAASCDISTFIEPSKALVQGEMSETGVTVKKLQLLEWEPE